MTTYTPEAPERPTNTWRRYLTDYNEGLGLVYERFVLNDFLEDLRRRFDIRSVLEAPLYGMAGVSGINDVHLAQNGVSTFRPTTGAICPSPTTAST
jgi:hypothetical protein